MNYYEHHIGDYIKDTVHLSMLEDSAYRRLIDAYYTRELPLPADRKACQKLARAQSKDERAAVDYILDEFFKLEDDGWHQPRCDTELAKYFAKQPEAEEKKESAKERQRKARERRKALFEELTNHGVHMPWNATTEALHAELSRVTSIASHAPVTRDNTCTQSPVPSPQTPVNPESTASGVNSTVVAPENKNRLAPVAEVCLGLKAMGYGDTNPHDPKLKALLDAGLTAGEIIAAGESGKGQGKGFRWVLATAEGRRRDAANVKPLPDKHPNPSGLSKSGQKTAEAAARWLESQGVQP